jgi:hypothetical protein
MILERSCKHALFLTPCSIKSRMTTRMRNTSSSHNSETGFRRFKRSLTEEREWRIVSGCFPKYTVPEIKFREGASMLLPYIEMALPADGLLFDEVILGPTEHNNLSHAALSTYLSNQNVSNTTVSSGIPYREW